MAIRVQQADISDFARMGLLAGKSIAAVREGEKTFQRGLQTQAEKAILDRQITTTALQSQAAADRQQVSIAAALEQQQIGIEASQYQQEVGITASQYQQEVAGESQRLAIALQDQAAASRQRIALRNQQEMQEFEASMVTQSQQRSQAWELEKIEVMARNRFALEENAYAMEFQASEANKIKTGQETQLKIAAINKAKDRHDISPATAAKLILGLETGIPQLASDALRQVDPAREAIVKAIEGKELSTATNTLRQLRGSQDSGTQLEIDQLLQEGNLQKVNRAIEILEGDLRAAGGVVKPVGQSTNISFLESRLRTGQHSTATNKVIQEALDRGSTGELAAVVSAVKSIEEDERRAETRATEVATSQARTTQSQVERAARKKLGVSTAADVLNRAIPRPMFF